MLLILFLSLVKCKWPREIKPKLDFHIFPLAETASSSYSETVSAGEKLQLHVNIAYVASIIIIFNVN